MPVNWCGSRCTYRSFGVLCECMCVFVYLCVHVLERMFVCVSVC